MTTLEPLKTSFTCMEQTAAPKTSYLKQIRLRSHTMFSWFKPKDPLINLNKQYRQKLEQAMQSQRNGDIRTYSALTAEAEAIRADILKEEARRA
ncbi:MAG: DUF6435 family protein [Pseudomonadales bacterium]|nr:DUF6435 family protein [Pseudomonadales bacterium]